ncbi:penicillin-binding protein 2 [bacterium]|nr:penicillin-binding protein 2 [bacterium]
MNSNSIIRIRFLLGLVVLFALVLVGKLYMLQILDKKIYADKADRQYVKPNTTVFDRGSIFFQTKDGAEVGAATVKQGFVLTMNPQLIKDATSTYEQLSKIVSVDRQTFFDKAAKQNDPYEELKKRLDTTTGAAIGAAAIPGIRVYKDAWRVYPADSTAANTIGLTGFKGDTIAGRYGLESYYENVLTRTASSTTMNFFAELFSDIQKTVFSDKPLQGDVVTTIEPSVQGYLEKLLVDTKAKWQSDEIGGIVIDPNTGAVYAMASVPTFNPNDVSNVKDPKVFSNPLVENNYEMGSIVKPLTMVAGIDSGTITPTSTYDDKGFLVLNGKRIENWDHKGHGVLPMQEILSQSLNMGSAYIAAQMGKELFSSYFLRFGLGDLTGIDQPNEQKGLVANLRSPRDIEHATAAYGQGIAMTPIETVRALSILANGGKLITPHIAERIDYTTGLTKTIALPDPVQVVKTQSASDVTSMLVKVVDTALKKGQVKMEHYSIAAKTGTAQIADHVNGGYYTDRYLHSFFGYFPAYKPRFLVFLYHVYPKNVQYASETLTDPFIDMTKFLLTYYEIPPDR